MTLAKADAAFAKTLPDGVIRETAPGYFEEPRRRFRGEGGLVVAPRDTAEVAAVVRACAAARVPIVPYGGGTGLVGGQVGVGLAPVILSLERMTAIREIVPEEAVLAAEAGCVLADVQRAAQEAELLFPLSLASEGSARIGGLLSTNAGGIGTLRYGNARAMCLGLEAVLPSGEVWNGLTRLRKRNMGYDLRHLMIGAEGTLGVITAATLELSPRPASVATAVLEVPDPAAALRLLSLLRRAVGKGVSAFELIARQGLEFLDEVGPEVARPFRRNPEWMVLLELGLSGADAEAALEEVFAAAMEAGLVGDGVVARSEAQRADFRALREALPEANRRIGSVSSHDVSVPLSAIPAFLDAVSEAVAGVGDFRINCFGHVGDGNLHWNVFPPAGRSREDYAEARPAVMRAVHDTVHRFGGAISAEHGIGRLKVADLERYGDPAALAAMRAIKAALDPLGLMNPGAVLAQRSLT